MSDETPDLMAALRRSVERVQSPAEPSADVQPGHDGVCGCGLPRSSPVHGNPFGAGHAFRPAAPSEPPAEAQQPVTRDELNSDYWDRMVTDTTPGVEVDDAGRLSYSTETPAKAQQDDERWRHLRRHEPHPAVPVPGTEYVGPGGKREARCATCGTGEAIWTDALAARPSVDTETLRDDELPRLLAAQEGRRWDDLGAWWRGEYRQRAEAIRALLDGS